MDMLTNSGMILGKNLWAIIIDWFVKGIANYGWAIILFTIALKLIMSPLDIYQRISTKKQQKYQTVMQPEIAALQAKYGNNREKLNQETAKVYKKYNFNMGGMCLSMLITMGLSMAVFFSLYGSLRSYGTGKLYSSYRQIESSYIQTIESEEYKNLATDEEKENLLTITVKEKYQDIKEENSWLWVKNVWKGDTKTSQFVSFKDYAKHEKFDNKEVDAEGKTEKQRRAEIYDFITETIDGKKQDMNGYYILIILALVISLLTQFLSTKLTSPKGAKLNTMNKVMMGMIPLTMVILAWTSNVVFTLYVITNSIMTAIITTILTLIMKKKGNGKDEDIVLPKKNVSVVEYSRNYKK